MPSKISLKFFEHYQWSSSYGRTASRSTRLERFENLQGVPSLSCRSPAVLFWKTGQSTECFHSIIFESPLGRYEIAAKSQCAAQQIVVLGMPKENRDQFFTLFQKESRVDTECDWVDSLLILIEHFTERSRSARRCWVWAIGSHRNSKLGRWNP